MNNKICKGKRGRSFLFVALAVYFLIMFSIIFANALSGDTSTSVFKVQYSNPYGSSYSSLMSGVSSRAGEQGSQTGEEFYDLALMIPPLGCEPYVVRSDLLEEQNVPVFCKLVPLKINPSISISRIESINIVQKEKNDYISGVGFHPSQAAISSSGKLVNNPTSDNIGYVVVVLKQQANEKAMPDSINVTLAATLQYNAENSFGIGENEFYLPVMTDEEFANKIHDYSFYNGAGYLRVEDMDENSALVSVYDSKDRRVFSDRIKKGETSNEFYLSNNLGGQGIKITLEDLTLPETKAKIKVNGNIFEVYKGGSFYDGKCTLLSLTASTAGSGTAKVKCGSTTFNLRRLLNRVDLIVEGDVKSLSIGEDLVIAGDDTYDYYLVYANQISGSGDFYVFLAKVLKTKVVEIGDKELKKGLNETTKKIENEIKKAKGDTTKIKSTTKSLTSVDVGGKLGKVDLISLSNWEGGAKKIDSPKVELKDVKFSNKPLTDETTKYFGESLDAYDKVNDLFYAESKDSKYTYGEYSLWQEYNLANYLGQGKDVLEILSKINNEYPESVSDGGSSANELINFNKMLSSDGASAYSSKDDIYIELISVTEPSVEESSVSLHYYSSAGNRAKQPYYKGSEILNVDNKGETTVNLVKFTETTAYFNCTYKPDPLKKEFKTITVNTDKEVTIKECKGIRIVLDEINLKKVADVKITPITRGRTRESNFTFSIGIEKRGISMDLTPEEANKKIEQLNKQISEWKNITEALSKVIEADKIACLGTSALINIKNLFAGKGGEATARKEVMQKWNSLCESVEFQKQSKGATNQEDCIANNYDQYIKPEIEATKTIMSQYNTDEKSMRDANTDSKTKLVNEQAAKMALIDKINSLVLSNTQVKDETGALKDSSYIKGILDKNNVNYTDYNDLSALYLDIQMISQAKNPKVVEEYQKSAYDKLSLIEERKKTEADAKKTTTIGGVAISQPITTKRDQWTYTNGKYDSKEFYFAPGMETQYQIKSDNPIAIISPYLFVLAGNREVYTATDVYEIINGHLLVPIDDAKKKSELINSHVFIPADQSSYKNKCKNCNSVKVFALEPYKGMPSLLPFDCENGWYVEVKQIMPNGFGFASGSAKSYFDSGALNSFWLCNVGSDGMMDGVGIDKNCIKFELSSGQPLNTVSGLSETEAKKKVEEAVKAVRDAQKKLTSNPTSLYNIGNCAPLKVKTVEGGVDGKCTDFMSPSDCQRIFNVCDPVVCPNSRCDFGGKFKVDNVIQSGIVGSTFLCLPNFIGFHPKTGVVVPVCLTGIHAGIEGWISILESYRDCINESVTNNKTVGICDMVNSVYVCDFFWRNAGPFAEALIKNLFLFAFGKGEHGGAEYAFVQDAWNNAENSMKYFQTAYAKDSKLTFGFKEITSSVVAEVCKSPMSVSYPNNFDAMLEPESPVQFHAFFEEVSYTDATVPPSSQYKVFYHIFAGNDQGHYYQVYLKSPPNGIGYYGKDRSVVASGYVPAGETRTETKDFIDVSGFQELCVKIDNQDKCGFKSVSTSAALNYAKDAAINDQLSNHVTTERECVSGSQSFGAFLTPNIQQGVEEFANPELYNQGITRVCSGENPGKGVDESRWKDVGYCDDTSIRCWVDERSVKNAIQGAGIENKTLSEIEKMNIQNIINQGGYLNWDQADKEIKSLRSVYLEGDGSIVVQANDKKTVEGVSYSGKAVDYENRAYSGTTIKNLDEDIKALDAKIALSSQKAELWALRAQIYDGVTRAVNKPVETSGGDEEDNTDVKKTEMIISGETKNIVFDYSFGGVIQKPLYFKFVNGKWGWAEESSPSIWKTAQDTYLTSSDDRKNIISELIAEKTYDDGLGYFIQSIIDNPDRHIETAGEDKKIAFQGTSQSYSSDPAQVFILINNDKKLYISFQNNNWKWNNSGKDGTWLPVFKVEEGKGLSSDLPKDFWDVINKLFNNNQQIDYNSALEIIFDFNLS